MSEKWHGMCERCLAEGLRLREVTFALEDGKTWVRCPKCGTHRYGEPYEVADKR